MTAPAAKPRKLRCSNCAEPLRALTLAGHYLRDVEIDLCDACCLIWFDTVESARLAGPGVAELIGVIHQAMSGGQAHPLAARLTHGQQCPICSATLKTVFNISRFGRTSQLQCPNGHGYYQTFMLYLAEKGFVRPIIWADVRAAEESGRALYCANCGAGMPARPHAACPYCQSAVGVLDPARLASAIDIAGVAEGADVPARRDQPHCASCGGALDSTRHVSCPHCQAIIRRSDTDTAVAASEAVIDAVRENYERQMPSRSRRGVGLVDRGREPAKAPRFAKGAVVAAVLVALYAWLR